MKRRESIPSILETDATGKTAEIYSDIRKVLGTSVVNLIWRHLATMPGALQWTWSTVRPLYLGTAPVHAEAVRRTLPLPELPSFSPDTLAAAGLGPSDLTGIRDVLDSYQYTNALALVVLSAMVARFEPWAADFVAPSDTAPSPPRATIRELLSMAALPPEMARLIVELNGFGEDTEPSLIASMYRHLAYWPAYLALVRTMLIALEEDGRLAALTRSTRALAHAHGQTLAPQLTPSTPPATGKNALCRLPAVCRTSHRADDRALRHDPPRNKRIVGPVQHRSRLLKELSLPYRLFFRSFTTLSTSNYCGNS